MDIKTLRSINSWWYTDNWEAVDRHMQIFNSSRYQYVPSWIDQISLEPFSLNFVIGPRQVGKTTGLKLLIKKLLEKKIDLQKIVYLDCEIFPDFVSLEKILLELLQTLGNDLILILDEASSLTNWWKPVKFLIDAGKLENSVIIVTGSSSIRVRKEAELFPGRRGKGKEIEALPLSFKEYIALHGIKDYRLEYDRVLELFKKYLETGGFLSVINGYPATEVLRGFISELNKFNKSLEIAEEIFASLVPKLPSPLSYRVIASETSGYSYKLIQEYIEFFRNLYILEIAYLKREGIVQHRKEKKIFFRDPLFFRIFSEWSSSKFLESALYEAVVQEHLLRKFGEVYYYRNRYEIDCIASELAIEVKAGKPHRSYPKNVKILEEEEIPRFLLEL